MTNQEIRERIDENNKKIQEGFSFKFVLNKEASALLEENQKLRSMCQHNFINGYCIYCDQGEN